jgi:hypothetical protein
MAFHAPDVENEPAGKTQEPQTPSPALPLASNQLLGSCLDLLLSALGTLLADVALGLALGGLGGGLGLVSLLGGGGSLLLLLALLDGLSAGGTAGLRSHRATLLDHIERGTDDGTLGLDGTASALLGDLLGDTLAVLSAVEDRPGDATGVLSLQEQRLRLAILETEDLAVATDVQLTLAGVNRLAGEGVDVGTHLVAVSGLLATRCCWWTVNWAMGVGESWCRDFPISLELVLCEND